MTVDHIGLFMGNNIMRYIGKIALPIFIYLLYEGCSKTKNIKKYMGRLLIMGGLMYVATAVAQILLFNKSMYFQNIFLTLFFLVLSYYLIFVETKKSYKFFIIFPIIYFVLSYLYQLSITNNFHNLYYSVLLDGLTGMYSLEAPLMFFFICLFNWIYNRSLKKKLNDDLIDSFKETKQYQLSKNAMVSLSILIVSAIFYGLTYLNLSSFSLGLSPIFDTYLVLSIPFILMYNGKRGYNNKYLNKAFYLYYPLHIGIIALIFFLIGGL